MGDDCIFCRIIEGRAPAHVVYEDEETLAFLDIRPFTTGHTLVVPKIHAESMVNLSDDAVARLFTKVKSIATMIKSRLKADGLNIGVNDGRVAGQIIFHVHVHIIPRYLVGDSSFRSRKDPGDEELERVRKMIVGQP